jgi:hypothetical protein
MYLPVKLRYILHFVKGGDLRMVGSFDRAGGSRIMSQRRFAAIRSKIGTGISIVINLYKTLGFGL